MGISAESRANIFLCGRQNIGVTIVLNKQTNDRKNEKRRSFIKGMRDGIPIGLGYLAVSFSLGIAAHNAGLSVLQCFLVSLLCNASAGEYAGFTLIAANASYIEMAAITLVANARYLLMSCAMSQRISHEASFVHRLLVGFGLTDELFGISVAGSEPFTPYYFYGAFSVASPCWAFGTALGALAGNVLPQQIVSALSVALFGMFLAVFVPPAKKDKIIAGIVAVCFAFSYLASVIPVFSKFSEGVRIIVLTVVISSAVALIFPRHDETENAE